jgi:hypothetical protein
VRAQRFGLRMREESATRCKLLRWVVVAALVTAPVSPAAQPLPAALQACARITRDSERLACFDREIAALSGVAAQGAEAAPTAPVKAASAAGVAASVASASAGVSASAGAPAGATVPVSSSTPASVSAPAGTSAPPGTSTPAGSAAVATLSPEQKLGLSLEGIRKLEAKEGIKSTELKSLTTHIVNVSHNAAGRLVFRLDNGQVWRQAETRSSFEAESGEVATISAGALGSFWLSTSKHNWTRVERIP